MSKDILMGGKQRKANSMWSRAERVLMVILTGRQVGANSSDKGCCDDIIITVEHKCFDDGH